MSQATPVAGAQYYAHERALSRTGRIYLTNIELGFFGG